MNRESILGFRVLIEGADFEGSECANFSGVGNIRCAPAPVCPNCGLAMFPALNFSVEGSVLALGLFNAPYVSVFFCPSCAHHLKPYWIRKAGGVWEVAGGYCDGGDIFVEIDRPFKAREIVLRPLSENDYPNSDLRHRALIGRTLSPGVYHQIGGVPHRGVDLAMNCCDCGAEMIFAGILDSDDLNVPLYENGGVPVALMIADGCCLNIYSCTNCDVYGLSLAR